MPSRIRTRASRTAADGEEDDERDDGPAVAERELVDEAEDERAEPARAALHRLVEAEVLRLAAARDELAVERPGQGLRAAEDEADEQRQGEEDDERLRRARGRRRRRRPSTGRCRRGRCARRRSDAATRPKSRAPTKATNWTKRNTPSTVVSEKPQLLDAVDARAADDGLDAVVEEEVREEEQLGLGVVGARSRKVLRSCAKLPPTTPAERSTDVSTVPVRLAQPEEGDDREHRPTTGQRTAC